MWHLPLLLWPIGRLLIQQFLNQIRCIVAADMCQNRSISLDALLIDLAFGHALILYDIQDVFMLFARNTPIALVIISSGTTTTITASASPIPVIPTIVPVGIGTG